jgi:hypothetical protein
MITSFIIHYFGWQARSRFGGHCPRWGRFAEADCGHEMRPMTFLDPGASSVTDPLGSPTLKRVERVALKSQSDHEFPVLNRESHALGEASPCLL